MLLNILSEVDDALYGGMAQRRLPDMQVNASYAYEACSFVFP